MDNKAILDNRWRYTDMKLRDYLKIYKKISSKTQDNIQDIFNSIDFEYIDLNKPISNNRRKKLIRIIDEWKESNLLIGYFGYKVKELIKKRYITNQAMLGILLWGTYIKERNQLDEYEQVLFTEIGQDLYKQGIEEIKPTKNKKWSLTWDYIWSMLCLPNVKGSSWITYIEALALTNAQEIERQTTIQLQQNKKPNIEYDVFQNIVNKQQNRYICINGDKTSGALDSQIVEIANKSFLKAGEDAGDKKLQARFISERDERTTKMCEGMDNMLFYVNDWNTFQRYSNDDGRIVNYKVFGLVLGVNLPPIVNHFHYCRSTITYLINMSRKELNKSLITWQEENALYKYLGGKSYILNEKMRNKELLTNDEKHYRKNLYRALNKMPYYNGNIVRVVDISDLQQLKMFLQEYQTNSIIKFRQFTSFSNKSNYNNEANIIIWVKDSKKARNVIEYSTESEVLYQYGTKFQVMNVVQKNDKYYILLEEL